MIGTRRTDGVVTSAPTAPEKRVEKAAPEKARALEKAAHDFEAIFVRSLLEQSGAMGKKSAYGDMAVSTLASAVTEGKGLGLGETIRQAIERAEGSRNHGEGR